MFTSPIREPMAAASSGSCFAVTTRASASAARTEASARRSATSAAEKAVLAELLASDPSLVGREKEINDHLHSLEKTIVRTQVVENGIRLDGRRRPRRHRAAARGAVFQAVGPM